MSIFSAIRAWFINPEPCAPGPAPKARKRRKRTTNPIPFKTMEVGDSELILNISRRDVASRVSNANRYYSDRQFAYTYNSDDDADTAVVMRTA